MHFVPELVTAFKRNNAGAHFRFVQAPRERLHVALLAGDLDACIACHKFADAALAWEPLWDEELLAFLPPAHPLARRRLVDLRELAGEPMLSFKAGERLRDEVDELAQHAGFSPNVVYEAGDIPTLLGLVSLGLASRCCRKAFRPIAAAPQPFACAIAANAPSGYRGCATNSMPLTQRRSARSWSNGVPIGRGKRGRREPAR